MDSNSDSDDNLDYDRDTAQAFETSALLALRRGDLDFAIKNVDGSLRCPICSPAKRKQSYAYKDLLVHAKAVAATGHRGPEVAGQHSAVRIFLENDLKELAPPLQTERVFSAEESQPVRIEGEDKLVFPWTVIILKILNRTQKAPVGPVGLSKKEMLKSFARFNPAVARAVQAGLRPAEECCGIIQFKRGLESLDDALALDNYFVSSGRSRREYQSDADSGNLKEGYYGWLGRRDDYSGGAGFTNGHAIAEVLQSCSDLTDVKSVAEETTYIYKLQLKNLRETLETKSQDAQSLKTEIGVLQHRIETERHQIEESAKSRRS